MSFDYRPSAPTSYKGDATRTGGASLTPPWERPPLPQVPYITSSSASASNADKDLLRARWATRDPNASRPRIDTAMNVHRPSPSGIASPVSPEGRNDQWKPTTPLTAKPLPVPNASYETAVYIPQGPRTAVPLSYVAKPPPIPPGPRTAVPLSYVAMPPPTPPDSTCTSIDDSPGTSPLQSRAVMALPGTMAARTRASPPKRPRRHHQSPILANEKEGAPGLGRRFRSVFRDLFKRSAVDESQFEQIEAHHWTDD